LTIQRTATTRFIILFIIGVRLVNSNRIAEFNKKQVNSNRVQVRSMKRHILMLLLTTSLKDTSSGNHHANYYSIKKILVKFQD